MLFCKVRCHLVHKEKKSFGQGNSVTPIQLVNATSAAINGGNLMTPYVLKYILNNTNDIMYEKTPITKRRVISEDTSAIMRYALESVVSRGTGRNAFKEGYWIGGKTVVYGS